MCCNSHRSYYERRDAAIKGWDTRRANEAWAAKQRQAQQWAAQVVQESQVVTFGGTLPAAQTSVVKEIERVPA